MKLFMVALVLGVAAASRRTLDRRSFQSLKVLAEQYEVPCTPQTEHLSDTVTAVKEKNAAAKITLDAHCQQRKDFAQGNYTEGVQTADATKSAAETHAAAERMKLVAGAEATYNASIDSLR